MITTASVLYISLFLQLFILCCCSIRSTIAATSRPKAAFLWEDEEDNSCNKWTLRRLTFPYGANSIKQKHDKKSGLLTTKWQGELFPIVHHAFSKPCSNFREFTAEEQEQEQRMTPESLLCTKGSEEQQGEIDTIVLQIEDLHHRYIDMLDDAPFGLNLWHFHANLFPIWLSKYYSNVVAHFLNKETREFEEKHQQQLTNENKKKWLELHMPEHISNITKTKDYIIPKSFSDDIAIILLLPPAAWNRISKINDTSPIFAFDGQELRKAQNEREGHPTSLSGLQGIADSFKGKLLAASYETSISKLRNRLKQLKYKQTPLAWIMPPGREGLMWHLAQDPHIQQHITECKGSALREYGESLINSVPIKHYNKLAKHVCIMSRQLRTKPGNEERFQLRNMVPEYFRTLIIRFASPIVINANLDIRNFSSIDVPLRLDKASISGQMRFLHHECAVVIGVHGAGLSSILGIRRGTAVIEMMLESKQYEFFKNVAHLMGDVDYHRVFANGSYVFLYGHNFEGNFSLSEEQSEILCKNVSQILRSSIQRQVDLLK